MNDVTEQTGRSFIPRPNSNCERFYLDVAVVWAERVNGATWKVYGPWHEPFEVDHAHFKKSFSAIY